MKKIRIAILSILLVGGIALSTACASSSPPTAQSPVPDVDQGESTPPTAIGYVYCTGNGVNIRAAASTDGKIVGSAYRGDKLPLIEKGEKWNAILHDDEIAFVSAAYCSTTPPSTTAPAPQPVATYDEFVLCTGDSVNIRAAASTSASVIGGAKKGKYYALAGQSGDYYKIKYRYGYGYISKSYAQKAQMKKSKDERIEKVLSVAYETIGTPYVYGATRMHGGTGVLINGFDRNKMDCSSLAQYAFFAGAKIAIGMNTATQQSQGKLVTDDLKRGDLLFFSSPQYVNHSLPTKIRHVGIYLGDDCMLHTANVKNNAEIIRLSDTGYWWQYLVFARRHF